MANSTKLPFASPVDELIQWRASLDPDSTSFVLTRSVKVVRSPCSNAKAAFAWKTKELQQFVCEQSVLNLDLSLPLVFWFWFRSHPMLDFISQLCIDYKLINGTRGKIMSKQLQQDLICFKYLVAPLEPCWSAALEFEICTQLTSAHRRNISEIYKEIFQITKYFRWTRNWGNISDKQVFQDDFPLDSSVGQHAASIIIITDR